MTKEVHSKWRTGASEASNGRLQCRLVCLLKQEQDNIFSSSKSSFSFPIYLLTKLSFSTCTKLRVRGVMISLCQILFVAMTVPYYHSNRTCVTHHTSCPCSKQRSSTVQLTLWCLLEKLNPCRGCKPPLPTTCSGGGNKVWGNKSWLEPSNGTAMIAVQRLYN